MAFIASETWSTYVTPFEHGSVIDYAFKLVFIWLTVLAATHQPAARQVDPEYRRDPQDRVPRHLPCNNGDLRHAARRGGPIGQRLQPNGGRACSA